MGAARDLFGFVAGLLGRKLAAYAFAGVAIAAFFGLAYAGVWVFSLVETKLDVLNATGETVEVVLDGETPRSVEPGHWILYQPMPGDHELVVRGPRGVIDERTISVGIGSAQVWMAGGSSRFAIVTRTRTADLRDVPDLAGVRLFVPSEPVFEFPAPVTLGRLDFNFRIGYGSEGLMSDETTRLCTLSDDGMHLGCESCERWDQCEPTVLPAPL